MNQTLLELLSEQVNEALELLEDVDDAGEARGLLKGAQKTVAKLLTAKPDLSSMGTLHPNGLRESSDVQR